MKVAKRLLLVITLTIIISSIFSACETPGNKPEAQTPANGVGIVPQSPKIMTGKAVKLSLGSYAGKITWSSSDNYIADVNNSGIVTGGYKGGSAIITADTGDQTYTCTVTNYVVMRDISPSDMVAEMKLGTNFARTMDDIDWTRKIGYDYYKPKEGGMDKIQYHLSKTFDIPSGKTIADFAGMGYNAVRLNVSFTYFTDDKTFVIDKGYLDLLEETVNRFLSHGMYCIIDPHYDYLGYSWVGDKWEQNWMAAEYKDYVDKRYAAIWNQVAERFKDYDDHLLFEAMNEPADGDKVYEEGGPYYNKYDAFLRDNKKRVAELNELFVKTVRATGGNNTQRVLSVSPMKQFMAEYLEDFTVPADDRLIVQVHYYFMSDDGSDITSWKSSNPADTKKIDEAFDYIKQFKDRTGLPVILGEWGNAECLPLDDRIDQAKYILTKAKNLGMPAFWWESTMTAKTDRVNDRWSLYNRETNEWTQPELVDAIRSIIYGK